MNVPRNHTAGGAINGKFYVVGGRGNPAAATALEVYDPQTNAWALLAPLPTGRSGIGAGVVNGELYVFGGEQPRLFSEVEVYQPLTNQWQQLPPMPTPRHGLFASVIGNRIYLPAGATQQGLGATNVNEVFVVNTATSVSAAGYGFVGPALARESIVAAFGAGLATAEMPAADIDPNTPGIQLPTSLAGTTVRVTDSAGTERFAPLLYVSPRQVNYQMPPQTASGPALVTVTGGDGTVSTGAIQIDAVAPGLFTFSSDGRGVVAGYALRYRNNQEQPPEAIAQRDGQGNWVTVPIDLGPAGDRVYLVLFGTGLRHRRDPPQVSAQIGGMSAPVEYAREQCCFVGLDQVNVLLPRELMGKGEVDLALVAEGKTANTVRVNIR
jgi:uncharacterized protein (TIGR03437 family)